MIEKRKLVMIFFYLNPEKDLFDGDGRTPILLLIQQGQADLSRYINQSINQSINPFICILINTHPNQPTENRFLKSGNQ